MTVAYTSFAVEFARLCPEWWRELPPAARLMLAYRFKWWARADQRIPQHRWRTCGFDGGRGRGKTTLIAAEINRRVEAGGETIIGLMAPSELRVHEVQISALRLTAPPWFMPQVVKQQLLWPNGVIGMIYTPGAEGKPRGSNHSTSWCTELVDWTPGTQVEAWNNLSSATRVGRSGGQIFWDSTHKGRNELLEKLQAAHDTNPTENVIIGGTTFDNPMFPGPTLRGMWAQYSGVRREEELFGRSFRAADGALWTQAVIDKYRVAAAPEIVTEHVGIDPAFTTADGADLTGLHRAGASADGHVYLLEDRSGRYKPDEWGDIAIGWMPKGGRCTIETNQGGNLNSHVLQSRAALRGMGVVRVGREDEWPRAEPSVVYVREVHSRESKGTRADGPAAETEAGRVHVVGELPDLELEMTTFVPGSKKSPNRLDAAVFAITELRGLGRDAVADPGDGMRAAAAMNAALQGGAQPNAGRGFNGLGVSGWASARGL